MTVQANSYTVTTTAQKVANSATGEVKRPLSFSLQNIDTAVTIYIGGVDVNGTTLGWDLGPGKTLDIDLSFANDLYAVTASGTAVLKVLTVSK